MPPALPSSPPRAPIALPSSPPRAATWQGTLDELGIELKASEAKLDPRPLLRLSMSRFFGMSYVRLDLT
jgi:hypothetical protein